MNFSKPDGQYDRFVRRYYSSLTRGKLGFLHSVRSLQAFSAFPEIQEFLISFTLKTITMMTSVAEKQIRTYYHALYDAWGPQHWWPARSPFEVVVGAYLTQNTSWKNVEIALGRLRAARRLSLAGIRAIPLESLEALIQPSGYFRQKARRLKTFAAFVDQNYGGSLRRLFTQPTEKLRHELLSLNGVGPETADSILLYAGQHPVFVVDAYTRRILERHWIAPANTTYEELRDLFERALGNSGRARKTIGHELGTLDRPIPHSPSPMSLATRSPMAQAYNEMHGLLVAVGKHYCVKSEPRCEGCPLGKFLP